MSVCVCLCVCVCVCPCMSVWVSLCVSAGFPSVQSGARGGSTVGVSERRRTTETDTSAATQRFHVRSLHDSAVIIIIIIIIHEFQSDASTEELQGRCSVTVFSLWLWPVARTAERPDKQLSLQTAPKTVLGCIQFVNTDSVSQ